MPDSENNSLTKTETLHSIDITHAATKAIKNLKRSNFVAFCTLVLATCCCVGLSALLFWLFWCVLPEGIRSGRSLFIMPFFVLTLFWLVVIMPIQSWNNRIIKTLKKEKPEISSVSLSKTENGRVFASYTRATNPSKDYSEIEMNPEGSDDVAVGTHTDACIYFEKWTRKPLAILFGQVILTATYQPNIRAATTSVSTKNSS